jgi:hypothetical protein
MLHPLKSLRPLIHPPFLGRYTDPLPKLSIRLTFGSLAQLARSLQDIQSERSQIVPY